MIGIVVDATIDWCFADFWQAPELSDLIAGDLWVETYRGAKSS